MGRPRLGNADSVIEAVRLSPDVAAAFRRACAQRQASRPEVLRRLINRWLRQMAHIDRKRKK